MFTSLHRRVNSIILPHWVGCELSLVVSESRLSFTLTLYLIFFVSLSYSCLWTTPARDARINNGPDYYSTLVDRKVGRAYLPIIVVQVQSHFPFFFFFCFRFSLFLFYFCRLANHLAGFLMPLILFLFLAPYFCLFEFYGAEEASIRLLAGII